MINIEELAKQVEAQVNNNFHQTEMLARKEFHKAIGRVSLALESLSKTGKNLNMNYKYMELTELLTLAVRQVLAQEGLNLTIEFIDNNATIKIEDKKVYASGGATKTEEKTRIVAGHASAYITDGQFTHPIFTGMYVEQANQDLTKGSGAILTYVRKYAYAQLLHIAADDNDPDKNGMPIKEEPAPETVKEDPTKPNKAPFKSTLNKQLVVDF